MSRPDDADIAGVPPALAIQVGRWRRLSSLETFVVGGTGAGVLLVALNPVAGMAAIVGTLWASRFSVPRIHQDIVSLIYRGALDEAWAHIYRPACRERDPRWKAFLVGFLGAIQCHRGRFDSSLALFREALAHSMPQRRLEVASRGGYAATLALAGEVDEALHALPDSRDSAVSLDWDSMLVWARAGQFEDVLAHRLSTQEELHRRFPGWAHRDNLLRAFAADRLGRGEAEVGRYLRRVVKPYPACFDYLGARWPEMRAFVATHSPLIAIERRSLPGSRRYHRVGQLGEPGSLPAVAQLPPGTPTAD